MDFIKNEKNSSKTLIRECKDKSQTMRNYLQSISAKGLVSGIYDDSQNSVTMNTGNPTKMGQRCEEICHQKTCTDGE